MNTLSKVYEKKHKQKKIQKAFNIIMIAAFIFMLVFAVKIYSKYNELQNEINLIENGK